MNRVLWIALALVVVGGLTAVGATARNCSSYNLTPVAAATTATPGPEATPGPAEYHKITPDEAKARMDSGDPILIIDVRTQEEYDSGHIPGAVVLPNETIGSAEPELLPDKDAEILVYCRSGRRSSDAVRKLAALGYTRVYDFGGIIDWPYETEK